MLGHRRGRQAFWSDSSNSSHTRQPPPPGAPLRCACRCVLAGRGTGRCTCRCRRNTHTHAHTRADTRRHAQTRTGHARRSGMHVVCAYLHHSSTAPYAEWAPTAAAPPPGMGSAEAARKLCKDFSHGGRSHFSGDVEFTMLTFGAKWVRGGHGNEGSVWAMELLRVGRRYLGLHQHK